MTEIIETEIEPRIAEQLESLQDHVRELDNEASNVRAIAEAAYRKDGSPRRGDGSLLRNLAMLGGLAGIAIGCWQVAPALSWIVMGLILLGIPIAGSLKGKP